MTGHMQKRFRTTRQTRAAGVIAVAMIAASATARAAELPVISSHGTHFVGPDGKPVVLKGCNLGNWFILEAWMFGGSLQSNGDNFKDQAAFFQTLNDRFGPERTTQLMDAFRESYVTARDFALIKSFGFNTVRLPFDYRLLQDDSTPDRLRPDAFHWLDTALSMAEAAGVYVILDMHGVPGGQSKQDHTGKADQDKLWHDPADQDRTIALWKAIAERYKGRSVVAAYDLINEPYGDFREDVRPELATLLPRIAAAIRATGDQHVLFFPGALNGGIGFYGDPHAHGMTNIGFTEHYYPGLFGSKSALETHARLLGAELPAKEAYLKRVDAPYFAGEFNVVLPSEDPNRLMRLYYDRFAEYGWASTMWSYKLIKTDGGASAGAWYMVTNADPLPRLDVATATFEALMARVRGLASGPIAVNEALRDALTTSTPAALPLAKYAPLATAAPTTPQTDPPGYASQDVGGATPGHTAARPGEQVEIVAGGTDINAAADAFRFVSKPATGAAELKATITAFADSDVYAKAGVMARWGDDAGAAMAMINVFPDGTVAIIGREVAGGPTAETKVDAGVSLPVQLRLSVSGDRAVASYRTAAGDWKAAGTLPVPPAPAYRLGLAVCAHTEAVLTTVRATVGAPGDAALAAAADASGKPRGRSLVTNGSFEKAGAAPDLAAGWNRWGDWLNHEDAWKPTHEGRGLIGYHHWQITGSGGSSGLWQDVKVKAGERYTFTLFAQHDPATNGQHDAETVELRLESVTPDGQITLNTRDFPVARLATGVAWSRVSVSGTAISDTVRVLAVLNASADPQRGGAVKLDDATLTPATDGR